MSDIKLDQNDTMMKGNNVALDQVIGGDVKDFFELLKPNVMRLVVFTAFVGLMVAPGEIHPFLGFIAILCIAVGAGASGCLNMWYEHKTDALMKRTQNRPIPSGRITPDQALVFGLILAGFSVMTLGLLVSWVASAFLAFTIFYYVVVYTMWLKPNTPLNIVIGGAAGAFPPMIGYAAVTNNITFDSIVLFLIIFMWTPPHFWALNLYIKRDYEAANIPMMPSVRGEAHTRLQILVYTYITAVIGVLPTLMDFAGILYGAVATILGVGFIYFAHQVYKNQEGEIATKSAKHLFSFSLLYLMLLYTLLLIEHGFGYVSLYQFI